MEEVLFSGIITQHKIIHESRFYTETRIFDREKKTQTYKSKDMMYSELLKEWRPQMLKDHDMVKINCDLSNKVLKGAIGTIVMVFEQPDLTYEVEFIDNEGYTIDILSVKHCQIEAVEYISKI